MPQIPKNWSVANGWLKSSIVTKDFMAAVKLVNQIAEIAQEINHHPDLRIYSYKKLEISIQSHDVGALTEKDFELAKKIDKLL